MFPPNRACTWAAADLQTAARSPALHMLSGGPGQHPSVRHLKHANFLGRKAKVKKLGSGEAAQVHGIQREGTLCDPRLNRALRTTGRDSDPYLIRPGPSGGTDPAVARSRQRPHGGQRPPSRQRTFTFEFTQASSKCPVYYLSWALRPLLHS